MESLFGYVESIVFQDVESQFTIARLKEPKKDDFTTILGVLPGVQPGEGLTCRGNWRHHPQHGAQFHVEEYDQRPPSDSKGIQKYLESGFIKGIGPIYAKKIVAKFKDATLDVIDSKPHRLLEIDGIGEKKIDRITRCWREQKDVRSVMIFLRSYGVTPGIAQKIFKAWGDKSIEKVKENPYLLAREIRGIGFKSADQIALNLGIPKDSALRIECGVEHLLWEMSSEGDTCALMPRLIEAAIATLEVTSEGVEKAIASLLKGGGIFQVGQKIWVRPLYLCELGIAKELLRLAKGPQTLRAVDIDKALGWSESTMRIRLASNQKIAVKAALMEKILILTGGPGTGKSTITKVILQIYEKLSPRILLAAPTGKAAKRMSQITHRKSQTIHSLLEGDFTKGGFKRGKDNPLECDLLILDEMSMMDTQLMFQLLKAIPDHSKVLFIGDADQLPSVGPGNVLKDLLGSGVLASSKLTQIFRQAAGSQIIRNAHKINAGYFPDLSNPEGSDFEFYEAEDPPVLLEKLKDLVAKEIPKKYGFDPVEDVQVLVPMRKGILGIDNLNKELQQILNPDGEGIFRMGAQLKIGDKVMQLKNNYQKLVFNGDVGRIRLIDSEEQTIEINFDGKPVLYEFHELDEITLAYAVSIHKYQGSETPCVVMPIHTQHFKLLFRNLLYTGITRGKKRVILLGTKKAIAIAIRNDQAKQRLTGLEDALKEFFKEFVREQKNQETLEPLADATNTGNSN